MNAGKFVGLGLLFAVACVPAQQPVSSAPIDDEIKRCLTQEKHGSAKGCWADFLSRYRDVAGPAQVTLAEEHMQKADTPPAPTAAPIPEPAPTVVPPPPPPPPPPTPVRQFSRSESTMVMDSLTPLAFGAILRTKGITFTSRVADGATNFRFQAREAGPHWITVILSPNGDILQTVAFLFRRSSDVSMARVNSWNKDKRFGRAYIDKDGDGVLESDLVLKGGVTVEAVNDWLDLYFRLLTAFAQHVGYRGS